MKKDRYKTELNILCIIALIFPLTTIRFALDNDIWFILDSGRYIVQHGFANIEPFTIHEEMAFSFEKWLTYVLYYEIYEHFNAAGLLIFVHIIAAATEIVTVMLYATVTEKRELSCILTAVTYVFMGLSFWTTRPQIFTYLALVIELYALEKYTRTEKTGYLVILPVLSVTLMQLHSTQWVMLFAFALPYLCEFKFFERGRVEAGKVDKAPLFFVYVISILCGALNPYGMQSVIYIFKSLKDSSWTKYISECQPPTTARLLLFLAPVLLIFILGLVKGGRIQCRHLFLVLGTALMSMMAVRNIAYAYPAIGLMSAELLKDTDLYAEKTKLWMKHCTKGVSLLLLAAYVLFIMLKVQKLDFYGETGVKEIADGIKEEEIIPDGSEIYCGFNEGSYLEWLGYRVYIDPRAEIYLKEINEKEDIFSEYIEFTGGTIAAEQIREKYGLKYYLVEKSDDAAVYYQLKLSGDYRQIKENGDYVLFEYR